MMKRLLLSITILAAALGLAGCRGRAYESGGEGLEIVTTLFPAYDFARQIAGDRANVVLLVPPGAEAHSYEPSARDIIRIGESDLFIYNGGESEAWVEQLLSGMDGGANCLSMLDMVELLEEEHTGHEHEDEEPGHSHMEYDEHVWTWPVNAVSICEAICQRLREADPENAEYYQERFLDYRERLEALDLAFREAVAEGEHKTLIFADRFPARYFVEGYGLEYYAAFPGCAEDTEPSAKTVAFLIDKVRQEQIPAVFYIEYSDQRMARVIREDTGCQALLFHTCHTVSREDLDAGASYLSLMEQNLENLKEALG